MAAKVKFKSAVEIIRRHRKKKYKPAQVKRYFIQSRYKPETYENIIFSDPYFTTKMPWNNEWRRYKGYAHLHSLKQAVDVIVRDKSSYQARYCEFRIEIDNTYIEIK